MPVLELSLELTASGRGSQGLGIGGELSDADDVDLLLGFGRFVKVRHGIGGERRGAGEDSTVERPLFL